jgi:type III secretion protein C
MNAHHLCAVRTAASLPLPRLVALKAAARWLFVVLVCITLCLQASAAGSPFAHRKFTYRADGKKLSEVLQDFAAAQSVPVVIDSGVEGTVNGQFNGTAESFLKAMSKTYGLIWYFDGVTLFIYPSRAMTSRVFRMRGFDRDQIRDMLTSFGLGDARFPLRFNDADQTLLAYGPPRHIELVQTVIDTLEAGTREKVDRTVSVVPLKFAIAADRSVGGVRLTGLATTLNKIFSNEASTGTANPAGAVSSKVKEVIGSVSQRTAELTFGATPEEGGPDSVRDGAGRQREPEAPKPEDESRPFFQPEEATNSIIVRGTPERMQQYEALIHQLDRAQDLIEIEATIIDVSTDQFDSLGIDWDYTRAGHGRITVSPGTPGLGGSSAPNITTLVADAGRSLLTSIRALEGHGKARIVARPKVLGAANRMASMADKRIASVRVAGNLSANLFTVEAGTTLEVTPSVVTQGGRQDVRLTVYIEDGGFEGGVVDSVPVVKRTEIRTEATIREGESLLIGGISVESEADGRSGLPVLSRIPAVGALFRHDEKSATRSERLFLLTPKVISAASLQEPVPALQEAPAASAPVPVPVPVPVPATPASAPVVPPVECTFHGYIELAGLKCQ